MALDVAKRSYIIHGQFCVAKCGIYLIPTRCEVGFPCNDKESLGSCRDGLIAKKVTEVVRQWTFILSPLAQWLVNRKEKINYSR